MTTTIRKPRVKRLRRALVEEARDADRRARTIERNLRLGRYTGRNDRFTYETLDRHLGRRDRMVERLIDQHGQSGRWLAGRLTEEFGLARRVSEARDAEQDRPELRDRLAVVQAEIRGFPYREETK